MAWRMLIVGGGVLAREGLRTIFSGISQFEVIGNAAHPNEAETLPERADIVLVVPGSLSKELRPFIERTNQAGQKIVLIAEKEKALEVINMYGQLVDAIVTDDMSKEDLIAALVLVLRGFVVLPNEIKTALSNLMDALPVVPSEFAVQPPKLTRREREVLTLLADNLTNKQIADRLGISVSTARDHVARVIRKLQQPTRHLALVFAKRLGLLEPNASTDGLSADISAPEREPSGIFD